jgi:hypothetical protein
MADGTSYAAQCNADGAVMTPVNGNGPTIYLGRSCDAFVTGHGAGLWGWANGGFLALVGEKTFPFGRQDFPCLDAPVGQDLLKCTPVPLP